MLECKHFKRLNIKLDHYDSVIHCDNLYMIKQDIPITLINGLLVIVKDECYRHSLRDKIITLDNNLYFLKYSHIRCVVLFLLKN